MRGDQLIRALRLIRHLEHGRWTLAALARDLEVTTRTIRRDLEVLSIAGIAVVQGVGEKGLYWIQR